MRDVYERVREKARALEYVGACRENTLLYTCTVNIQSLVKRRTIEERAGERATERFGDERLCVVDGRRAALVLGESSFPESIIQKYHPL